MKKKLLLALSVVILMAFSMNVNAAGSDNTSEVVQSGTWGSEINWTLDAKDELVITGEGTLSSSDIDDTFMENVKSVVVKDGITRISNYAFASCRKIERIVLPDSVTEIGSSAFSLCTSLKEIKLPGTLKTISNGTFMSCESLVEIDLPSSVNKIEDNAFVGCSSLKSIDVPGNVRQIPTAMFRGCTSLESVKLPYFATYIGTCAFDGCTSLKKIELPARLTTTGSGVFSGCTSLEKIRIPASLEKINYHFFMECSSLSEVVFEGDVKEIGMAAFRSCTSLKNIKLPESLEVIKADVFEGCTALESILLPVNVKEIDDKAFHGASSLKKIEVCNKDCLLPDSISKEILIRAHEGSKAHEFAIAKGNPFEASHYYGDGVVVEDSTYDLEGKGERTCLYCDAKEEYTIEKKLIESIWLDKERVFLKNGQTVLLEAKWDPATERICVWSSQDESIARVDENGLVKAVGVGKTRVAATVDGKTAECIIIVDPCTHTYKEKVLAKATTSKDGKLQYTCTKCGHVKASVIYKIKTVQLSKKSYVYDGKVKKPAVTVKNRADKVIKSSYYKVIYPAGRKNIGKYQVKINFNTRYYANVKREFTICPKTPKMKSIDKSKTKMTVTWKKVDGAVSGYEVRYARNSQFKNYKVKRANANKNNVLIKNLASNKKYYVKVRAYKDVNGKRIYSSWSKVETVRYPMQIVY